MAMDGFNAVRAKALAKVRLLRITEALCRLCTVNLAAIAMELVGIAIPPKMTIEEGPMDGVPELTLERDSHSHENPTQRTLKKRDTVLWRGHDW